MHSQRLGLQCTVCVPICNHVHQAGVAETAFHCLVTDSSPCGQILLPEGNGGNDGAAVLGDEIDHSRLHLVSRLLGATAGLDDPIPFDTAVLPAKPNAMSLPLLR